MALDILKGVLVGICASAPVGPTAVFIIQRALTKGHKPGFVTALGSCAADTFYAIVSVFALVFAEQFIDRYQVLIYFIGGVILALMGLRMVLSDPTRNMSDETGSEASVGDTGQAVVMALTNPGSVFFMLSLFAFFGLAHDGASCVWNVIPIIAAVALGTMTYWFTMTWIISRFRRFFSMKAVLWFSRFTGIVIILFGAALICRGMIKVLVEGAKII